MDAPALLSGGAGADAVYAALRSRAFRSSVRASLTELLKEPAAAGPCRLRRTKFKPGHRLTASFETTVRGERHPRAFSVTWRSSEGWPAAAVDDAAEETAEAEAHERGVAGPFRSLRTLLPALRMRLDVSPFDPSFPALVRLVDPVHVAGAIGLGARPVVSTVRYRPGERHVLRYDVPTAGAPSTFYAKLYRDDRGARAVAAGAAIADYLASNGIGIAVAAPTTHLGSDQAVMIPNAAGAALSAVLRRRAGDVGVHVRAAGCALRAFHDAPPELGSFVGTYVVEDELAKTDRTASAAKALVPTASSSVAAILDGARRLLADLPDEAPVLTHGDYKADHVLVGRRTTILDLDRGAVADPALDLAKFLADLRWWLGGAGGSVDAAQEQFLAGYGPVDRARLARARALEPVLVVKLAARRIRVHERAWTARTVASIALAGALLDEVSR